MLLHFNWAETDLPLGVGTQYLQSDITRVYYVVSVLKRSPKKDVLGTTPFYNSLFHSFMELININSNKINNTRVTPQFDIIN